MKQTDEETLVRIFLATRELILEENKNELINRFYNILFTLWSDRKTVPIIYTFLRQVPDEKDLLHLEKAKFFHDQSLTAIDYFMSSEMPVMDPKLLFRGPCILKGCIINYLSTHMKKLNIDFAEKIPLESKEASLETKVLTCEQLKDLLNAIFYSDSEMKTLRKLPDEVNLFLATIYFHVKKMYSEQAALRQCSELLFFTCMIPSFLQGRSKNTIKEIRAFFIVLACRLTEIYENDIFQKDTEQWNSLVNEFEKTHRLFIEKNIIPK